MARNLSLYPAHLPLTAQEQELKQHFIDSFTSDYNVTSESDKIMLELASIEFIKGIRLQIFELETGKPVLAARQHPLTTLDRILSSLDATRAARMRGKKPVDSDDETELKEYFLSLSKVPTNTKAESNGHAK